MKHSLFVWDQEVAAQFPRLAVSVSIIKDVRVEQSAEVERLRNLVFAQMRSAFRLEELKDDPVVRAYRDFFWALNIDPTKTRPSGEALLRRVLHGEDIPRISSAVDSYNLASLQTIVPISGFDLDILAAPLHIRFSKEGDVFQGIGMQAPKRLEEGMLVVADSQQILCIYPHKDADSTKITFKTKNILLVGYGAPNISKDRLVDAVNLASSYIKQTSRGRIEGIEVSSAGP